MRGGGRAEIGIVTVGKAHHDLHARAAPARARRTHPAIAIYKVALIWPLETEGLRAFARGKRALLVVEEKRSFVEAQLRDALYNLPADAAPAGRRARPDLDGAKLLPAAGELSPEIVMPGASCASCAASAWMSPTRRSAAIPPARPKACSPGRRCSAPAARTTPPPSCPMAATPWPGSAATSWR